MILQYVPLELIPASMCHEAVASLDGSTSQGSHIVSKMQPTLQKRLKTRHLSDLTEPALCFSQRALRNTLTCHGPWL